VINKALKNDANILMINMSDRLSSTRKTRGQSPLTDQMTDEILKLYCERKNSKYSCLAALDNMPDSILLPERYVSGKQIATSDFGGVRINEAGLSDAYRTTLKDAGKFFRGVNVSNYFEEDARGTFSIINYQDIQNGLLNIDSVKQYRLKESKTDANKLLKYRVAAGDILISCKGHAIKTCLVPELPGEYLLSLNFAAIRINHEEFHSGFIKYYLDSPVGQYLIESRQMGSSIITLNIKDLEQIPIPLPPLERQMEYHDFLYSGSERIYKSMQLLEKQLADLKWAFYEKLGLETIMEKEQEHEKQSAER
jgi:type I restriction enzyme M protein